LRRLIGQQVRAAAAPGSPVGFFSVSDAAVTTEESIRGGAAPHRRDVVESSPPELTVVLPTLNEAANVGGIVDRLAAALHGVAWEVVFVDDDSADGTAEAVRTVARSHANVRLIRRIGRRGLSSAVIEGALSSMAPFIAVMDADMQHDEAALPRMLEALRGGAFDVAVGTRYGAAGGIGEWSRRRHLVSLVATKLAKFVLGATVSDPMSGYFVITRQAFDGVVRHLSGQGFKILLDMLASSKNRMRIVEVGYQFRPRQFGESKLDGHVALDYLALLLDKALGRFLPVRFMMFAGVGSLGLVVHMSVLTAAYRFMGIRYLVGQTMAIITAMTFNFFINNLLTYRDRRIRGLGALIRGLFSFYVACLFGSIASIAISQYLFSNHYSWWLAALGGLVVGAVWNYATTSRLTWRPA
jgi:dolichol-phosphate mannosyltransferase